MAAAGAADDGGGIPSFMTQKPRVVSSQEVGSTRWLKLSTLTYTDRRGTPRAWDVATRTTTKEGAGADAVGILVILKSTGEAGSTGGDQIVLVKQFRPPMNAMSIEMPAGLIDDGEDPQTAALRELYEETGYVGEVKGTPSPPIALSPGLTNERVCIVQVEVDLSLPENQNPTQHLEEAEDIEVLKVPLDGLLETLNAMAAEGCSVFAPLYSFAMASSLGR